MIPGYENKSCLNRLQCKQSGGFIAFPNAVIDAFVSLRHSTAVYLLKSGVDLSTIAHWLGHSSINTTHKYVSIDLEAKRAALAKAAPITAKAAAASSWKPGEDLLKWLESL